MQFYSDNDLRLLGLEDELNKRQWHNIEDIGWTITPKSCGEYIYTARLKKSTSNVHYAYEPTNVTVPGELPHRSLQYLEFGWYCYPRASQEVTAIFETSGIWLDTILTKSLGEESYQKTWNYLEFDWGFNQELPKNLPRSLKHLGHLDTYFNQELPELTRSVETCNI